MTITTKTERSMIPSEHELCVFQTMAKQAVNSKLYRGIGDEFAVMTIMLAARELEIPPMAALNGGINIINGKTEISSRMMAALIMKRGHSIEVVESTADKCILKGVRVTASIMQEYTESFTFEEAKQAGLIKDGGGWKKWPKDMCYARCLSRLARRLFPDVIGMGYIEGEIHETNTKPMVPTEVEVCAVEDRITSEQAQIEEQALLKNFLSQFDKEEAMGLSSYIAQLKEKRNITVDSIVQKYNEEPAKVMENFQSWLKKQK